MTIWEKYHKNGLLPNLWKGFTGQLSAEVQTQEALDEQRELYEKENQWQREKYAADMDFANRQLDWQMSTAEQNFDLQKQQFQYQKDLNNLQMQREDNAMQRQVADLTKAGFSPLAAIGGSGSAAGSLNAGVAPQMDTTGVGNAAGQYLDIARQYASLHQELSSKNADARLGAKMALNQMKADLHFKGQNMATQYFNAAVNAKNRSLQNQSLEEDITTKKYQNDWYKKHGYNNVTLATVLSDFLKNENISKSIKEFGDMLSNGLESLGNTIKDIKEDPSTYMGYLKDVLSEGSNKIQDFSEDVNNGFAKKLFPEEYKFLQNWLKEHDKLLINMSAKDWIECSVEYAASKRKK